MKKFLLLVFCMALPSFAHAQTSNPELTHAPVTTDCVIRDFHSDLVLQKTNALDITETLLVDCGNLPNKHGIFRVLPTRLPDSLITSIDYRETAISNVSISTPTGQPYKYSTSRTSDTLTWKIGDPKKTISGNLTYVIKYSVANVISQASNGQPQFYWNLSGDFWELPIDHFDAKIHFPGNIDISTLQLASGAYGSTRTDDAIVTAVSPDIVTIDSLRSFAPGEGITVIQPLPSGLITPFKPTFAMLYGKYGWFFVPLVVFILCFQLWRKYGRDPRLHKAQTVQFAPPVNMRPLELGMLESTGNMDSRLISATIIDLAVRGYIKITEVPKKWLFGTKDWELTLLKPSDEQISSYENKVLAGLFGSVITKDATTTISDQRNKFYTHLPKIKESAYDSLVERKLINPQGAVFRNALYISAAIGLFAMFFTVRFFLPSAFQLIAAGVLTVLILGIFGYLMPNRTREGAELNWQLDGFKLYMKTAEQYRQQFNEQEHIFERFLPYAIGFGLVKQWAHSMEAMYGAEYLSTHAPVWYYAQVPGSFNFSSFADSMDSVASSVSSSLSSNPSSSGSGGGFSGGGGGGGGGGSW